MLQKPDYDQAIKTTTLTAKITNLSVMAIIAEGIKTGQGDTSDMKEAFSYIWGLNTRFNHCWRHNTLGTNMLVARGALLDHWNRVMETINSLSPDADIPRDIMPLELQPAWCW